MKGRLLAQIAVAALAAACLFAGIGRGEQEAVLRKAVRVCMECIGLG